MTDLETIEAMLKRAGVSYVVERDPSLIVVVITITNTLEKVDSDWRFRLDGSLWEVENWNLNDT